MSEPSGVDEAFRLKRRYVLADRTEIIGIRTNAARTEAHAQIDVDLLQGLQR